LSPTFHRAFDRGLIAISDDYRVLVHPELSAAVRPVGGSAAEFLAFKIIEQVNSSHQLNQESGSMRTRSFTFRAMNGFILRLKA